MKSFSTTNLYIEKNYIYLIKHIYVIKFIKINLLLKSIDYYFLFRYSYSKVNTILNFRSKNWIKNDREVLYWCTFCHSDKSKIGTNKSKWSLVKKSTQKRETNLLDYSNIN